MSMYRQLWLAIVVSTLLALSGSLLAFLLSAQGYLESQLTIKNTDNATALALSLSQGNPDAVMADLVVASLFDSGHYELIRIADPVGKLIAERVAPADALGAPRWFARMLPLHAQPGVAQITSGWKQFGTVTLVSHSRFAYAALWKSAYELVFALTVAGLVGGYLGSMVLRRLRGPLDAVIEQAKAITQRRFVTIEEPEVPELKQLATAMNATVGRLKSMFDDEAARLEAVRKEANFDSLTGLANRAYFMARLRETTAEEDSVGGAVFIARVANLDTVNQSLGRNTTDKLLQAFGKAMTSAASQHVDTLAARLNGADFALLVPGLTEPHELAQRLLHALVQNAAVFLPNQPTTWVGGVYFPSGSPTNAILAQADSALAGVQTDGRNGARIVDMRDMQDAGGAMPTSADEWTRQIARALDQNWVMLASFPVVSLDGRLLHQECPLRLKFDEKGDWLPAGRFLPVAERLGLTASLDLAAVHLGLQQLQSQPQLPGLAINLSASSLEDPAFQPTLLALLDAKREQAAKLWLEVSESGALTHLPALRALCVALAARGCRTGIEHFGHQFSQIGLLHNLGLDYIKVDSSFVCGVDANAGNAAFLRGLRRIAHNIGLQVLAEGVNTTLELGALNDLGFDGATGPGVREL